MADASAEFSIEEARSVLAGLQAVAPDALEAPLSHRDHLAILAAGVEVKSLEDGLIDFPMHMDSVPAYWCWRSGEQDILWWHPRDTGFAGRRRIVEAGSAGPALD